MYGTPAKRPRTSSYGASSSKRPRTSYVRRRLTRIPYNRTQYTRKVPVRTKTATKINKSRIQKLEEKVNGHLQRGYHRLQIRYNPQPGGFVWGPQTPLLLCLNDFYTQTTASGGGTGSAFFPLYSGAVPNLQMSAGILDRWADYLPGQSLGHSQQYQQWKDQRYSQPSKVGYQPIYSDIRVVVNRDTCTPEGGDWWIRVDCFHAKKTYLSSSGGPDPKVYNMPTAVGALSNLAVAANVRDNEFNPALWTKKTRWIKLRAPDVPSRNLTNIFHIKTVFPKEFIATNVDVDSGNVGEQFWNCVDPKKIKWCLLSISKGSPDSDNPVPTLFMTRHVTYRDSRGHQM